LLTFEQPPEQFEAASNRNEMHSMNTLHIFQGGSPV